MHSLLGGVVTDSGETMRQMRVVFTLAIHSPNTVKASTNQFAPPACMLPIYHITICCYIQDDSNVHLQTTHTLLNELHVLITTAMLAACQLLVDQCYLEVQDTKLHQERNLSTNGSSRRLLAYQAERNLQIG